jgi:hypothetical protein
VLGVETRRKHTQAEEDTGLKPWGGRQTYAQGPQTNPHLPAWASPGDISEGPDLGSTCSSPLTMCLVGLACIWTPASPAAVYTHHAWHLQAHSHEG